MGTPETRLQSSRYDRDPGRWRPYKYGCAILVPVAADAWGEGVINIMNQPFVMDRITHSVVGNTNDYHGTGLADDGQYYIQWHDEHSEYQNMPLTARNTFGTKDFPLLLTSPIGFAGNKVLTFRVTNAYLRVLTPEAEFFKVEIIIHGQADWGPERKAA